MLGWLVGMRRRGEQLAADKMRAATLGDRIHRLSQALATISTETLTGKDATERAENAAATLTTSVAKASIGHVKDDDDRFVAGIFAFVFADYFSSLLGGTFEFASSFAVLRVLGTADWERCFNTILDAYNNMVQSKSKTIEVIGLACEAWLKSPDESRFAMLVEVFKMVREHVAVK
jgi:hypothetical protein